MSLSSVLQPPVVVFGAKGFIGSAVARAFEGDGFEVVRITSRNADFSQANQVATLRERIPPGALWILAAARSPDYPGDANENAQADRRTTENLCALARLCAPAGAVFLSSIDVYGRTGLSLPLSESSPLRPETPFARMKITAEAAYTQMAKDLGIPLLTLRLPGVYGPGDSHHGPMRSFMDAALRGAALKVFGNGNQRRDLLYVEDVFLIVMRWLKEPQSLLSNAVTGANASLNDMIKLLRDCSGLPLQVERHADVQQVDLEFSPPRLYAVYPDLKLTPLEMGIPATWRAVSINSGGGLTHAH